MPTFLAIITASWAGSLVNIILKRICCCFEWNCFFCDIGPGLLFHEKICIGS